MTIVGAIEPPHELGTNAAAQHAATFQPQPFAGDDQHDAQVAAGGLLEEDCDGALGSGQRHAVQVE